MNKMRQNIILAVLLLVCMTAAGCGAKAAEAFEAFGQPYTWGCIPEQAALNIKNDTALQTPPAERSVVEDETLPLVLSETERLAAMEAYGIEEGSNAALALEKLNDVYAKQLSESQWTRPLIFFFEGAGSEPNPSQRRNALCVVVRNGRIVYLNQNSTTIPDYPFVPRKNDGRDVPTLKSGIYSFDTVNHNGQYAALRVLDDQVVRFHTPTEFYADVSYKQSIEIHRRVIDEVSPADENWGSSVGCLLVGDASTDPAGTYAGFVQAVGVVPSGASGGSRYRTQVTGTVIVDRSFGVEYLRAVGYPDEGIEMINGG